MAFIPVYGIGVIRGFRDRGSADIYDDDPTPAARRRLPRNLWRIAQRKLQLLHRAVVLFDLAAPPANHLEVLKGERRGQHSIRINDQYRICFVWTQEGPTDVEIVDYH
jgi:proteic killer suppression protein